MKSLQLIVTNARYFGPVWVFASINILVGTWAIYIPTIKETLDISKSELGVAIFALALGVFFVFPFASLIIHKLGVGKCTFYGVVLSGITAILPFLAPNYYLLMAALFLFGAANGLTDISMNTLVTEIEKKDRVKFMAAAHGFYSLGGVLAGFGSFLIGPLANPTLHITMAVLGVLLVNFKCRKKYFSTTSILETSTPFHISQFKPLFVLGLISFLAMGSEGGIVDWSGLYLKEVTHAPQALWGIGFLAFQCTMTLGRFLGDGISARIGALKMITIATSITLLGYGIVLSGNTYLAMLGFALNGIGFSVMVPEVFRIGGKLKGVPSSQGIAFIAGAGYAGFLSAPPLLGFLADKCSLTISFTALFLSAFLIAACVLALKTRSQ